MANSQSFPQYFKLFCLSLAFVLVSFYGCQPNKKTASVDKKAEAVPAQMQKSKPDIVRKYVKGPGMPAVSCCKGFPSRGKALAAKK